MTAERAEPQPTAAVPQLPPAASRPTTAAEFQAAMVHLYRGEVGRANTWRSRLDGTTNWAVLTTATTLSFAFSSPTNTHVLVLVNSLFILFFMYIEARRYRFYDLWRSRIRLIEVEFFAEMLTPSPEADDSWRALLADDLLHPRFSIPIWEALGRRLRRNYIWLFAVLFLSWCVKVLIHPFSTSESGELLARIAIGPLPAWFVLSAGVAFNSFLAWLLISTREQRHYHDEGLPRAEARQRMGTGELP
ncbi:MAG: DUF2270 domain-containing protein [Roseiflexaceae bacterium]|nr:DUF2270 domain-containing protein [Roseiflexaceae bacterium]